MMSKPNKCCCHIVDALFTYTKIILHQEAQPKAGIYNHVVSRDILPSSHVAQSSLHKP